MNLRTSALVLAASVAALAIAPPHANAGQTAPAIGQFDAAFAKVNAYTYKLHAHEEQGSSSQNRVYQYSFMKPHFAKTLIESGDGSGSGAVWTGGDQVSGHQGGFLSGIHLKVGLHDGRAVSLRGYTIPDGLLQNIVANYANIAGTLTQSPGGKVGGGDTDRLDLKVSDPSADGGITERVCYLSQDTHFPVREILYQGSKIVVDQSVTDLNTSANLSQNDFPF